MYSDGTLHDIVDVECTGTEHYLRMRMLNVKGLYWDGTLHNHVECTGTEHYITIWNVEGQSLT